MNFTTAYTCISTHRTEGHDESLFRFCESLEFIMDQFLLFTSSSGHMNIADLKDRLFLQLYRLTGNSEGLRIFIVGLHPTKSKTASIVT